jgi:hypothetical protein
MQPPPKKVRTDAELEAELDRELESSLDSYLAAPDTAPAQKPATGDVSRDFMANLAGRGIGMTPDRVKPVSTPQRITKKLASWSSMPEEGSVLDRVRGGVDAANRWADRQLEFPTLPNGQYVPLPRLADDALLRGLVPGVLGIGETLSKAPTLGKNRVSETFRTAREKITTRAGEDDATSMVAQVGGGLAGVGKLLGPFVSGTQRAIAGSAAGARVLAATAPGSRLATNFPNVARALRGAVEVAPQSTRAGQLGRAAANTAIISPLLVGAGSEREGSTAGMIADGGFGGRIPKAEPGSFRDDLANSPVGRMAVEGAVDLTTGKVFEGISARMDTRARMKALDAAKGPAPIGPGLPQQRQSRPLWRGSIEDAAAQADTPAAFPPVAAAKVTPATTPDPITTPATPVSGSPANDATKATRPARKKKAEAAAAAAPVEEAAPVAPAEDPAELRRVLRNAKAKRLRLASKGQTGEVLGPQTREEWIAASRTPLTPWQKGQITKGKGPSYNLPIPMPAGIDRTPIIPEFLTDPPRVRNQTQSQARFALPAVMPPSPGAEIPEFLTRPLQNQLQGPAWRMLPAITGDASGRIPQPGENIRALLASVTQERPPRIPPQQPGVNVLPSGQTPIIMPDDVTQLPYVQQPGRTSVMPGKTAIDLEREDLSAAGNAVRGRGLQQPRQYLPDDPAYEGSVIPTPFPVEPGPRGVLSGLGLNFRDKQAEGMPQINALLSKMVSPLDDAATRGAALSRVPSLLEGRRDLPTNPLTDVRLGPDGSPANPQLGPYFVPPGGPTGSPVGIVGGNAVPAPRSSYPSRRGDYPTRAENGEAASAIPEVRAAAFDLMQVQQKIADVTASSGSLTQKADLEKLDIQQRNAFRLLQGELEKAGITNRVEMQKVYDDVTGEVTGFRPGLTQTQSSQIAGTQIQKDGRVVGTEGGLLNDPDLRSSARGLKIDPEYENVPLGPTGWDVEGGGFARDADGNLILNQTDAGQVKYLRDREGNLVLDYYGQRVPVRPPPSDPRVREPQRAVKRPPDGRETETKPVMREKVADDLAASQTKSSGLMTTFDRARERNLSPAPGSEFDIRDPGPQNDGIMGRVANDPRLEGQDATAGYVPPPPKPKTLDQNSAKKVLREEMGATITTVNTNGGQVAMVNFGDNIEHRLTRSGSSAGGWKYEAGTNGDQSLDGKVMGRSKEEGAIALADALDDYNGKLPDDIIVVSDRSGQIRVRRTPPDYVAPEPVDPNTVETPFGSVQFPKEMSLEGLTGEALTRRMMERGDFLADALARQQDEAFRQAQRQPLPPEAGSSPAAEKALRVLEGQSYDPDEVVGPTKDPATFNTQYRRPAGPKPETPKARAARDASELAAAEAERQYLRDNPQLGPALPAGSVSRTRVTAPVAPTPPQRVPAMMSEADRLAAEAADLRRQLEAKVQADEQAAALQAQRDEIDMLKRRLGIAVEPTPTAAAPSVTPPAAVVEPPPAPAAAPVSDTPVTTKPAKTKAELAAKKKGRGVMAEALALPYDPNWAANASKAQLERLKAQVAEGERLAKTGTKGMSKEARRQAELTIARVDVTKKQIAQLEEEAAKTAARKARGQKAKVEPVTEATPAPAPQPPAAARPVSKSRQQWEEEVASAATSEAKATAEAGLEAWKQRVRAMFSDTPKDATVEKQALENDLKIAVATRNAEAAKQIKKEIAKIGAVGGVSGLTAGVAEAQLPEEEEGEESDRGFWATAGTGATVGLGTMIFAASRGRLKGLRAVARGAGREVEIARQVARNVADAELTAAGVAPKMRTPAAKGPRMDTESINPREVTPKRQDPDNVRRLGLPPVLAQEAQEIINAQRAAGRTTVTNDETLALAGRLYGMPADELVKYVDRQRVPDGETLVAVATMFREKITEMAVIKARLDDVSVNWDAMPGQRDALKALHAKLGEEANWAAMAGARGSSEQGRALQANKIMAKAVADPSYWVAKAHKAAGRDLTMEEIDELTRLASSKDPADRAKLLTRLKEFDHVPRLLQAARIVRAGFLTRPAGRVKDVISSVGNMVFVQKGEKPLRVMFDKMFEYGATEMLGLTQKGNMRTELFLPLSNLARRRDEVLARTKQVLSEDAIRQGMQSVAKNISSAKNAQEAAERWVEAMRTPEVDPVMIARGEMPALSRIRGLFTSPDDPRHLPDQLGKMGTGFGPRVEGVLDLYVQTVNKATGVADKIVRSMAYDVALQNQATARAHREGLRGAQREARAKVIAATASTDPQLLGRVIDDVSSLTFINDGALAVFAEKARRAPGKLAKETALTVGASEQTARVVKSAADAVMEGIVLPFARVPANLASKGIDYSPLGALRVGYEGARWADEVLKARKLVTAQGTLSENDALNVLIRQRKVVDKLTKATVGTFGLMGLGMMLAKSGAMTGAYPKNDPKRKAARDLDNAPANSILIGGKWRPIAWLGPQGMALAMGATLVETHKIDPDTDLLSDAGAAAGAAAQVFLDAPMMQGAAKVFDAAADPARKGATFVQQTAASIVPSAVAAVAQGQDGIRRKPENVPDAVMAKIPGLQDEAPPALNALGDPIKAPEGVWNQLFSPVAGPEDGRGRRGVGLKGEFPFVGIDMKVGDAPTQRTIDVLNTTAEPGDPAKPITPAPSPKNKTETTAQYRLRVQERGARLRAELARFAGDSLRNPAAVDSAVTRATRSPRKK